MTISTVPVQTLFNSRRVAHTNCGRCEATNVQVVATNINGRIERVCDPCLKQHGDEGRLYYCDICGVLFAPSNNFIEGKTIACMCANCAKENADQDFGVCFDQRY